MNVLITGGSGQLGSFIFDEMRQEHHLTGVDLVHPRYGQQDNIIISDIRDADAMTNACKGMDVIIHTAAQVSVQRSTEDPLMDADMNVIGTINMLRAAKRADVSKFIYISSAAVYGNPKYIPIDEGHPTIPLSFYGTSKLSAEYYVKAFGSSFGLGWVIVRPFNFYSSRADPKSPYSGVITKFTDNAKMGLPIRIEGDGNQTRDFLHAIDVAHMLSMIVRSDVRNVTFNCGSGHGTTINELAEMIREVSPMDVDIEHVPPRTADIHDSIAEVSEAERLLGYKANIDLRKGLASFFYGRS